MNLVGDLVEHARAYEAACKGVVDAYRHNDLGLHVRVRCDSGKGEPHDYVAVFEALPWDDFRLGDGVAGAIDEDVIQIFGRRDGCRVKDSMSVFPSEVVEPYQAVAWSVVRLHLFNEAPMLVGELLYPVLLLEKRLIREDRELDRLRLEVPFQRWVFEDGEQRELIRNVVQRRSRIIEERAKRLGKVGEQLALGGWVDEATEACLPPITLALTPDGIRAFVGELLAERGEGFSIAIRPFEALPRVRETAVPEFVPRRRLRHDV